MTEKQPMGGGIFLWCFRHITSMKKMVRSFDVVIEQDRQTNQLYASVPSLPGCYSYADDMQGLLENIKEAIELYLEALKQKNQSVEADSVLGMVKVTV